nr:MAG TPA: hypothetical protein [Caudoviricetes sp.]
MRMCRPVRFSTQKNGGSYIPSTPPYLSFS